MRPRLFRGPPWATMPVLSHGAGGERTDIVCGYLHSEDPLFDPNLGAFPPAFVVHLPDGPAARWVESSIEFALSVTDETLPAQAVSTRLPELLLIEVLRAHLADAPVADHGWIAALRDPSWRLRWRDFTRGRTRSGPLPGSRQKSPYRGPRSTIGFGRSWVVHRSAT